MNGTYNSNDIINEYFINGSTICRECNKIFIVDAPVHRALLIFANAKRGELATDPMGVSYDPRCFESFGICSHCSIDLGHKSILRMPLIHIGRMITLGLYRVTNKHQSTKKSSASPDKKKHKNEKSVTIIHLFYIYKFIRYSKEVNI